MRWRLTDAARVKNYCQALTAIEGWLDSQTGTVDLTEAKERRVQAARIAALRGDTDAENRADAQEDVLRDIDHRLPMTYSTGAERDDLKRALAEARIRAERELVLLGVELEVVRKTLEEALTALQSEAEVEPPL